MRNGPYELIIAPKEYPGKLYRGRYAYEHHYVYWRETGQVVKEGEVVHHKNDDTRDNRFENLELHTQIEHITYHLIRRRLFCPVVFVICPVCFNLITKPRNRSHIAEKQKTYTVCSKKCVGLLTTKVLKTLDPTEIFILQEKVRKGN